MKKYDIGIGWVDPVEKPFVDLLKKKAKALKGLSVYEITYRNLEGTFYKIDNKKIHFDLFIDRGSLDDGAFILMGEKLKSVGTRIINDPDSLIYYAGKEKLHEEFLKKRFPLPKTFIINGSKHGSGYFDKIAKKFKVPFVLKPSHGGGAEGVLLTAKSGKDIQEHIEDNFADSYLAQEYIVPGLINGKVAWFRPVYVLGRVIPLWWSPSSHFYEEFGKSKDEVRISRKLNTYMHAISKITGFELFSAEFAIKENGKIFIIDYANQPIDLNTQEYTGDGIPAAVLNKIVESIISIVSKH